MDNGLLEGLGITSWEQFNAAFNVNVATLNALHEQFGDGFSFVVIGLTAPNSGAFNASAGSAPSPTLLRPGMSPHMDAALRNPNVVEALGVIYLQNRNETIQSSGNLEAVTEHYFTIYSTAPHVGQQTSNTQINDLNNPTAVRGSVRPSIDPSRTADIAFLVHGHPPGTNPNPSWPADFSSQNAALRSRGLWTAIVNPTEIHFTGPNGQYYNLPASAFINAGRANGTTVSTGTVTIGAPISPGGP